MYTPLPPSASFLLRIDASVSQEAVESHAPPQRSLDDEAW